MLMNLLKMTQSILSSMDSDEINDINDTVEAQQVVDIIEQTYNDICAQVDFPDHWDLFELQPSNDVTRPTVMYLPEGVAKLEWLQYDHAESGATSREWRPVLPMERQTFFNRMNSLNSADNNVYQFDYLVKSETFDVRGYNDRAPTYFTTTDNRTLIFDSFDLSQGSTLIGNRTKAYGMRIPVFERVNTFVPQFEPRQFTLFFNEAKAQCFIELKQVQNAKAEQRARRGWVYTSRKKNNTAASGIHSGFTPNYGRGRIK